MSSLWSRYQHRTVLYLATNMIYGTISRSFIPVSRESLEATFGAMSDVVFTREVMYFDCNSTFLKFDLHSGVSSRSSVLCYSRWAA